MRFLIRVDGDLEMGGGHVMRCLTLAQEARARGHAVGFVMTAGAGSMCARVQALGFDLFEIAPRSENTLDPAGPDHQKWLRTSWRQDAQITAAAIARFAPDWLIWDHYGLDARWVREACLNAPVLRVLAVDDLDDRALASHLVLDQTALTTGARTFPADATLKGPEFALLRPEFAKLRAEHSRKRAETAVVSRVLIAPGMVDGAGLAPLALRALADFSDLKVDVVMGAASQTVAEVRRLVEGNENWSLTLDSPDMADFMVAADMCIGAGGMTSWERCCLGLPALAVGTADNQNGVLAALGARGAIVPLTLDQARDPARFTAALREVLAKHAQISAVALDLCDGQGAMRVLDALEAGLRPVTNADARRLFDWRNQPKIRAVSLHTAPLIWEAHEAWLHKTLMHKRAELWIYQEGGRDLGHVNLARTQEEGAWRWGFYIGAEGAPRGAGRRMLARALETAFSKADVGAIVADVRADNHASVALHRHFGFQQIPTNTAEVLAFKLDRCDVNLASGQPHLSQGTQSDAS